MKARLFGMSGAAVMFCLFAPESSQSAAVVNFGDITLWVGTGSNRAALVIDWNDGLAYPPPINGGESLAWGFRWDGQATGKDMFEAIAAEDPRLHFNLTPPANRPGGPNSVYNIGYDLDGDGFTYVPGPEPGSDDAGLAGDPGDHYREGWFRAGFWSYWQESAISIILPAWAESQAGYHLRDLVDGSWDGWSWAADFQEPGAFGPDAPLAAVPEGSAATLSGIIALFAVSRRWRGRGVSI